MDVLTLLAALVSVCAYAQGVSVETTITKTKANVGEAIVFTCKVKDGQDYTVQIKKGVMSGETDADGSQKLLSEDLVTIDDIHTKYRETGRFTMQTKDDGPWKHYELHIQGVTIQDSGYYVCALIGTEYFEHKLLEVYKMPSMISFHNYTDDGVSGRGVVAFMEGEEKDMTCTMHGVLPIPDVQISVHNVSYTEQFTQKISKIVIPQCHNIKDDPCLLHFYYKVTVRAMKFSPSYKDDNKDLMCESILPGSGLEPSAARLSVSMQYKPKFDCMSYQRERLGEGGSIRCMIQANPKLSETETTYFFQIDDQSTTLMPGQKYMEGDVNQIAMSQKRMGTNKHEAILTFARVEEKHYMKYKLTASNERGQNSTEIDLVDENFVYTSGQQIWSSMFLIISAACVAFVLRN